MWIANRGRTMSEKPIVKGDMVIVVSPTPCCGSTRRLGYIGTVTADAAPAAMRTLGCDVCGRTVRADGTEIEIDHAGWIERRRVRRIDPDCLKEEAPHAETLAA